MHLVVEDDPVVSKIIKHLIQQTFDSKVVYARSMAELNDLLAKHGDSIQSALIDLCLPDAVDGLAVTTVMQAGIPCVVLTATDDPEIRSHYLQAGVADYVIKSGRYWYLYAVKIIHRLGQNQRTNVLVVDDSFTCINTMKRMLESNLFKVHTATCAESALRTLEESPDIHILVIDHELPGMNGLELVQVIRCQFPKRPLGIIAISGVDKGRAQLTVDFIKSGADDFLPKPFDHQEFMCRITKSAQATESLLKLQDQAERDFLTGLYNRRYFSVEAETLLERYQNTCNTLALIDIDYFKKINDEYGHQSGDIVLKRLAEELALLFPKLLVARVGGEEFAVLMPTVDLTRARALMDGFRQHVQGLVIDVGDGDYLRVSLSVGLCECTGGNVSSMFSVADECLYRAKIGGRNQVVGVQE